MSTEDYNNTNKKYYTIGQVAELFAVSTSLVRFWEKKFKVLQPQKNKYGIRQYTPKDIKQLQCIYTLVKEQGYSLSGAQKVILAKGQKENGLNHQSIVQNLKDLKELLLTLKQKIK